MTQKMKALISIDYTNDFVAPDGKLTTGEAGQKIQPDLVALTEAFYAAGDYIVFAIDRHDTRDSYHPESTLFPPHNLAGSAGRKLYGDVQAFYDQHQADEKIYWLDKRHYSAFSGTDLDIRLRERGITQLHLAGVCTDICVLHTAIDAYNLGYKIVVHEKCVASFDPIGHTWALNHLVNCLGAEIKS